MIRTAPDRRPNILPWLKQCFVPLNVALAVLAAVLSLFGNEVVVTGLTAQIGVILLVATLIPPNLLHLERFKRGVVKTLATLRAPFGISAGVWFVAHAAVSLQLFKLSAPLWPQFFTADMVLGGFAFAVFAALLATSNTASQRRMGKNWKRLQRLVWFAVPLALVHALLSSLRFLAETESVGAALFIVIVGFIGFEWVSSRRVGAARKRSLAHVRLALAGAAVAALLYATLPARTNDVLPGRPAAVAFQRAA